MLVNQTAINARLIISPIWGIAHHEPISGHIVNFSSMSAAVVKAVVINQSGGDDTGIFLSFTSNDLIGGKLIKAHNLNRRIVEVAITNSEGIEFQPRINNLADNTRVEIDLTRFDITGTWYLYIR